MARKRSKPRSFFEPWLATKNSSHGPEPSVEGLPEDAATSILDAWERADRTAPWTLWGSGMVEPGVASGYLSGKPVVMDDKRIITEVRKISGLEKTAPTNGDVAQRIAACVTAMSGVADPEAFMDDLRALLLGYAQGECDDPREDVKVISLLGRCIPLNELEQVGYAE